MIVKPHALSKVAYLVLLAAALTCSPGCQDPIEWRMESAQRALDQYQPSQALKLAQEVLDRQPENFDAALIKASALLKLQRLDECRKNLDKLELIRPNLPAIHHLRMDWGIAELQGLLVNESLHKDIYLQRKFGEASSKADSAAKWLKENGNPSKADLALAQLAYFDALRLEAMLKPLQPKSSESLGEPEVWGRQQLTADQIKQRIQSRWDEALAYLKPLIGSDGPLTRQALEVYAHILIQMRRDDEFYAAAKHAADLGQLPDTLVSLFVTKLLEMPDSTQPLKDRLQLARRLQDAVQDHFRETLRSTLTRVRIHQAAGEWDRGVLLLTNTQDDYPNDPEVRLLLAKNLYGQGDYSQAMSQLLRLGIDFPRMPQVKALQGLVQIKMDRPSMARLALREALDLNPDDLTARSAFLELLLLQGYTEPAQQDLDLYLHYFPNDPTALRVALRRAITTDNTELIEKTIAWILRLPILEPSHLELLTDALSYLHRFDEALPHAQRRAELLPNSLDALTDWIALFLHLGRDAEANDTARAFYQNHPEAPSPDVLLARAYLPWNPAKAALLLEGAVHDHPNDLDLRVLWAQALARSDQPDAAAEQIQLVLDQEPESLTAHAQAWHVFQLIGWDELADFHLRQVRPSKLSPEEWPAMLARAKMLEGEFDLARRICTTALLRGDTDPLLQLMLIQVLHADGQTLQEETHLKAYLNTTTDYTRGFEKLTQYYLDQANPQRGIREISLLAHLNEGLAATATAKLLRSIRRNDEAAAKLQKTYDLLLQAHDPSILPVADALAQILIENNEPNQARNIYQRLNDAGLQTIPARIRRAHLAATPEQRALELRNLADEIPDSESSLARPIASALLDAGQPDQAIGFLERLITHSDHPLPLLRLKSDIQAQTGQLQAASQTLQRATTLAPRSADLHFKLGDLLAKQSKFPDALREFEATRATGPAESAQADVKIAYMMQSIGLEDPAQIPLARAQTAYLGRDPQVLLQLGQTLAWAGKFDKAIEQLLNIPPVARQYPQAQLLTAYTLLQQGRSDDARDRVTEITRQAAYMQPAAQVILDSDPANPRFHAIAQWADKIIDENALPIPMKRAWLAQRLRIEAENAEWLSVVRTLKNIQEDDPSSPAPAAAAVALLIHQERVTAAKDAFLDCPPLALSEVGPLLADVLGLTPSPPVSPTPTLGAYFTFALRGQFDQARSTAQNLSSRGALFAHDLAEAFNSIDTRSPQLAQPLRQVALAYAATYAGLPQLASLISQDAATEFPRLILPYSLDANASLTLEKTLIKTYNAVERTCPHSDLFLYLSARDRAANLDFAQACQLLQQILDHDPTNNEIRILLAQYLASGAKLDPAVAALRAAYEQDSPQKTQAATLLAQILLERQPDRLEEFRPLIESSLKLAPDDPILLHALGWARHLQGDDPAALPLLQKALVQRRNSPDIHYHVGLIYHALGLTEPWARYHLQQAAIPRSDEPTSTVQARQLLRQLQSQTPPPEPRPAM